MHARFKVFIVDPRRRIKWNLFVGEAIRFESTFDSTKDSHHLSFFFLGAFTDRYIFLVVVRIIDPVESERRPGIALLILDDLCKWFQAAGRIPVTSKAVEFKWFGRIKKEFGSQFVPFARFAIEDDLIVGVLKAVYPVIVCDV